MKMSYPIVAVGLEDLISVCECYVGYDHYGVDWDDRKLVCGCYDVLYGNENEDEEVMGFLLGMKMKKRNRRRIKAMKGGGHEHVAFEDCVDGADGFDDYRVMNPQLQLLELERVLDEENERIEIRKMKAELKKNMKRGRLINMKFNKEIEEGGEEDNWDFEYADKMMLGKTEMKIKLKIGEMEMELKLEFDG